GCRPPYPHRVDAGSRPHRAQPPIARQQAAYHPLAPRAACAGWSRGNLPRANHRHPRAATRQQVNENGLYHLGASSALLYGLPACLAHAGLPRAGLPGHRPAGAARLATMATKGMPKAAAPPAQPVVLVVVLVRQCPPVQRHAAPYPARHSLALHLLALHSFVLHSLAAHHHPAHHPATYLAVHQFAQRSPAAQLHPALAGSWFRCLLALSSLLELSPLLEPPPLGRAAAMLALLATALMAAVLIPAVLMRVTLMMLAARHLRCAAQPQTAHQTPDPALASLASEWMRRARACAVLYCPTIHDPAAWPRPASV